MRRLAGLPEVEAVVGQPLGHSAWHEVTQAEVDAFAAVTHDQNWLHTDPGRAAHGPFGGTVAHGMFTVAHLPSLLAQVYAIDGLGSRVSYGLDTVRFPAPLPVGVRVRGQATLVAVRPEASGTRVTTRVVVEREGSERPVCVADVVTLYLGTVGGAP